MIYDLSVTNEGDESDSFALEFIDQGNEGWVSNLSQFDIDNLVKIKVFGFIIKYLKKLHLF